MSFRKQSTFDFLCTAQKRTGWKLVDSLAGWYCQYRSAIQTQHSAIVNALRRERQNDYSNCRTWCFNQKLIATINVAELLFSVQQLIVTPRAFSLNLCPSSYVNFGNVHVGSIEFNNSQLGRHASYQRGHTNHFWSVSMSGLYVHLLWGCTSTSLLLPPRALLSSRVSCPSDKCLLF